MPLISKVAKNGFKMDCVVLYKNGIFLSRLSCYEKNYIKNQNNDNFERQCGITIHNSLQDKLTIILFSAIIRECSNTFHVESFKTVANCTKVTVNYLGVE